MSALLKHAYGRARPWLVKSLQIGAVYAAGDFTQQKLFSKVEHYDYDSTKRIGFVGGCMLAPFYVGWYGFLARRFPGTATVMVLKKLAMDQIFAGTLGICVFFVVLNVLERKEDVFAELIEKGPTAYLCNILYFPAVMFVIFKKVPVHGQPIAVALADFLWSIFLCYYKMKDTHNTTCKSTTVSKEKELPITQRHRST